MLIDLGIIKDTVIDLYRKGITELEKGIEIQVHGSGEHWTKAQRIQEKMIVNLAMAKERLDYLSMYTGFLSIHQCFMYFCLDFFVLPFILILFFAQYFL